jgi:4-hydroxybenzoyl-CoA reductase subunit alpha
MSGRTRFDVIGKPRRRVDGRAKVTGQTRFADDIVLPRMLHTKLLRSPHPHARIVAVDGARAAALPGVHLVLTGADFPVTFGILPVSLDEYPLARERVRYVGDPVAAVVARDEQTADEALALIDVGYEILPTIASPEEALAHPETRIHEYNDHGNIHRNQAFEFGDVDAALAASDHVFDDLFFFEGNTHLPIEQHAAVAAVDGEGKLTLWSSTQVPHYVHRQMARVLAMPEAHIRIIACPNGGGFGGKTDVCNHEAVVAKAALVTGRPVKICLTREEVFYMHRGRHPVLMRFRTGVNNDGTITGMHLSTLLDGGAYGSYGAASTFYTGALQTVTYHLPRYRFEACRTFTNKPPCGPKRGHGTPQPRFGQEIQLDKIAEKLVIDPAQLRLNMVAPPNSLTANWLRIGSIGLAETSIASFLAVAAWGSPAARTCAAPGCRSTGTSCRTPVSSCWSTAAGRSPCSAARPRSVRAPTTCWPASSPRSSASIRSTSAA